MPRWPHLHYYWENLSSATNDTFFGLTPNFNSCSILISAFTWEAKSTHISLRFQTGVKASSVHMKFHFDCILKQPDILMDMCRHFISGSVYMIFYHPKWNFISVKMTDMKSIPALSLKRTCALIAISNESELIHFVSGKLCSHENLMPV